jgi:hypothetical protein
MEAPHHHAHRRRLRDRFLKCGFADFAEHDIGELLLKVIDTSGNDTSQGFEVAAE